MPHEVGINPRAHPSPQGPRPVGLPHEGGDPPGPGPTSPMWVSVAPRRWGSADGTSFGLIQSEGWPHAGGDRPSAGPLRSRCARLPRAGGGLPRWYNSSPEGSRVAPRQWGSTKIGYNGYKKSSRLPRAGGDPPLADAVVKRRISGCPMPVGGCPYRQGKVSRYRSMPHADGQSPNQPEIVLQTPYHPNPRRPDKEPRVHKATGNCSRTRTFRINQQASGTRREEKPPDSTGG